MKNVAAAGRDTEPGTENPVELNPAAADSPRLESGTHFDPGLAAFLCAASARGSGTGEYPRDLAALAPEFLREVPRDAMDGKPLRYRLEADGSFLLYSVGADGEDNGGDASPTEIATPNKEFWRGRDAVWPRPASPEEVKAYRTVIRSWRRRNPGAPGIVVTNRMSETRLKELIRIYPPVFALPP